MVEVFLSDEVLDALEASGQFAQDEEVTVSLNALAGTEQQNCEA